MLAHKIFAAVIAAWEMLIDWPLPAKLQGMVKQFNRDDSGELIAMACPLAGVIFGAGLVVLSGICGAFFGRYAGMVLWSAAAVVLLELKDSGRGFSSVVSGVSGWIDAGRVSGGISSLGVGIRDLSGVVPSVLTLVYPLLKLAACMVIFWCQPAWIIAAVVLNFSAQGYLAALPGAMSSDALLPVAKQARFHLWWVAGFILLFFIGHPAAPLVSVGFAVGGSWFFGNYCVEKFGGVDAGIITVFGAITELTVLIIGALTLLGS